MSALPKTEELEIGALRNAFGVDTGEGAAIFSRVLTSAEKARGTHPSAIEGLLITALDGLVLRTKENASTDQSLFTMFREPGEQGIRTTVMKLPYGKGLPKNLRITELPRDKEGQQVVVELLGEPSPESQRLASATGGMPLGDPVYSYLCRI